MSNLQEKYLMNNLVGDYQKLTQDIIMYENELSSRDRKWKEIGGIKNPDFEKDRKREFIDNKITDLRDQRNKIWNFLVIQFNANTKIRNSNFERIKSLDNNISNITTQIREMKEKIENGKGFIGKKEREHQILVYQNSSNREMIYIHIIGLVKLIILCGLMMGVVLGKITLTQLYISAGLICSVFLLYIFKIVYVDNINKNIRFDNEFDFNKPDAKLIMENQALNQLPGDCKRKEIPEFKPTVEQDADLEKIKKTVDLNDESCLAK